MHSVTRQRVAPVRRSRVSQNLLRKPPLLLLLCGLLTAAGPAASAAPLQWPLTSMAMGEVRDLVRHLLVVARVNSGQDRLLHDPHALYRLYRARRFQPLWVERSGVRLAAGELLSLLRGSADEGLRPAAYTPAAIEAQLSAPIDDLVQLARLELRLTAALLRYLRDLHEGRIDPMTSEVEWFIPGGRRLPLAAVAAAAQADDLATAATAWRPTTAGYRRLHAALGRYRELAAAGGWPGVAEGESIRPGMRDPRLPALRQRLLLSGDLAGATTAQRYDGALVEAVRRFQRRHGLVADGVVGTRTRQALNRPAEERVAQLALNLERQRWLSLPNRYLLVNMADFSLQLVVDGAVLERMRVIVGRDYRQTPVFTRLLREVVFNPYWYVPRTILQEDILPRVRHDPGYLERNGFALFTSVDGNGRRVDVEEVKWGRLPADDFPYVLRQSPGPENALGRVKFLLPNPWGVYLHDTPNPSLFQRQRRAFSSGCIRVEAPAALAAALLGAEWDRDAVRTAIASGKPRRVAVENPLPVFLTYLTAWVDEVGRVHFRDDLYGRDERLAGVLEATLSPARMAGKAHDAGSPM